MGRGCYDCCMFSLELLHSFAVISLSFSSLSRTPRSLNPRTLGIFVVGAGVHGSLLVQLSRENGSNAQLSRNLRLRSAAVFESQCTEFFPRFSHDLGSCARVTRIRILSSI